MSKEMDALEKAKIYTQCISLWGVHLQTLMVVEELAELIFTISKYNRGKATASDITEEIADCRIMMNQLMYLTGITEEQVKNKENEKMERLKGRVEEAREKRKNRCKD